MPSGIGGIAEAREEVIAACFGDGWVEYEPKLPIVEHHAHLELPLDTSSVYIGVPSFGSELRPSQWCNPFDAMSPSAGTASDLYEDWLNDRADLEYFLRPLFGKTLRCTCESPGRCHGAVLVRMCHDFAQKARGKQKVIQPTPDEDDKEDPPTQTGTDTVVSSEISRAITMTEEWTQLVSKIRGLSGRCFWEVFAGSAILTERFHENGLPTAPPVDIATQPTFDLLNPCFLAVVLGVLLEGRVLL